MEPIRLYCGIPPEMISVLAQPGTFFLISHEREIGRIVVIVTDEVTSREFIESQVEDSGEVARLFCRLSIDQFQNFNDSIGFKFAAESILPIPVEIFVANDTKFQEVVTKRNNDYIPYIQ